MINYNLDKRFYNDRTMEILSKKFIAKRRRWNWWIGIYKIIELLIEDVLEGTIWYLHFEGWKRYLQCKAGEDFGLGSFEWDFDLGVHSVNDAGIV